MWRKLYKKHRCSLMLPLVLLVAIDVMAFEHIIDDIIVVNVSTRIELIIFTISMFLTFYYIFKQHQNIRDYCRIMKITFKRWFK